TRRADAAVEVGVQVVGVYTDARGEFLFGQPRAFHEQAHVAGHLGALVGLQVQPRAFQYLGEGLGDAVWPGAVEDLLDLAGRAAVGVTLERRGDALPGGDVAALHGGADRGRGPEL